MSKDIFNFLERLKMLSSVKRFGTIPSMIDESVSEHSFNVAFLAMLIADYEGVEIDIGLVFRKAIFHDFSETIMSDIPYPVKHKFKDGTLGESLKEIEVGLIENEIYDELPNEIKKKYIEISKFAKEGSEGKIIEAADAMDVVLSAIRETNVGNKYYSHVYDAGMKLLNEHKELKFVKLFIRNVDKYRNGLPHVDMEEEQ